MPRPRISVLLPAWNAEPTLADCLDSLLAQTETRWECILVDDGSSDRTAEIGRHFEARDGRIRAGDLVMIEAIGSSATPAAM